MVLAGWLRKKKAGGQEDDRARDEDMLARNYRVLNELSSSGTGVLSRERARTYVYSAEDEMVEWRDVERHAAEARQARGEADTTVPVRTERFHGSSHVAHVRLEPERYWRIVDETWRAAFG